MRADSRAPAACELAVCALCKAKREQHKVTTGIHTYVKVHTP